MNFEVYYQALNFFFSINKYIILCIYFTQYITFCNTTQNKFKTYNKNTETFLILDILIIRSEFNLARCIYVAKQYVKQK